MIRSLRLLTIDEAVAVMRVHYWKDPGRGERQSVGIELWALSATDEIIGVCSEFDLIWQPFRAAIDGAPGTPRPKGLNLVPDRTMRPASLEAIEAAGLADDADGSFGV